MTRAPILRTAILRTAFLAAVLVACSGGDTNFSAGNDDNSEIRGTSEMVVYPADEVLWEGLWPDIPCTEYVRLENGGDSDLIIDRVDITETGGGVFSISGSIEDEVVNPGDAFEFGIQATLGEATEAVGELRVRSNDAQETDLRITLRGTPDPDWTEGDTGEPGC